ncbi:MAG: hypothetical protein M0D55_00460 [Elusimicrobiota bacterium]|nr:MAG: hypothetical protein M0D55_00460 [Elusimicrobiota bacterium]
MRPLLLAALLAGSAAAAELTTDPDVGVRAQKARDILEEQPVEARVELKRMYRRYKEIVPKKLDAGWATGLLSEAVIEGVDEPFQPARLVDDMIARRRKEVERVQAALAKVADDDPYNHRRISAVLVERKAELARLLSKNKREKGICRDWSDLVWSEFVALELEHWAVRDERRTARPYHTAAVACTPVDDPKVCLVFDPWADGRPNVYTFTAWDESSPGGRFPAEYFNHHLPDKAEKK